MEDPIRTLTVSQQVTLLTPPRKSEQTPSRNCYMSRVWGVSPAASGAYSRVLETWREQPEPHICGAVSTSNSGTSKVTISKRNTHLACSESRNSPRWGLSPPYHVYDHRSGPTHTRRLGSKTPRCPFTGAQDPPNTHKGISGKGPRDPGAAS